MTLQEFKIREKIDKINLYNSTKSDRKVGSFGDLVIITKEEFDPEKDVYVYPTEKVDMETGEVVMLHVLSNKAPREADLVL